MSESQPGILNEDVDGAPRSYGVFPTDAGIDRLRHATNLVGGGQFNPLPAGQVAHPWKWVGANSGSSMTRRRRARNAPRARSIPWILGCCWRRGEESLQRSAAYWQPPLPRMLPGQVRGQNLTANPKLYIHPPSPQPSHRAERELHASVPLHFNPWSHNALWIEELRAFKWLCLTVPTVIHIGSHLS